MDLYQTNQNLGLEMHNILLIYEKVNDAWYVSTALSGRAYCFQLLFLSLFEVQC